MSDIGSQANHPRQTKTTEMKSETDSGKMENDKIVDSTKDKKQLSKPSNPNFPVRKAETNDEIVDIADLLFTQRRKYLINRTYHDRVRLHDLDGKFLCIYFVQLSPHLIAKHLVDDTNNLIDLYDQLSKTNKDRFEVVFVGTDNVGCYSKPLSEGYEALLSSMPWPAIPFKDFESRKHACDVLGVSHCLPFSTLVLLHPNGKLLRDISRTELMDIYGAESFPFTLERILELQLVDYYTITTGKVSLETLLRSSVLDFDISNVGMKVPIHHLKQKTVGLFLYREDMVVQCNRLTDRLKWVYETQASDFEVVLVHLYFTEHNTSKRGSRNSFWKIFKSMPWLALDFGDPNCRKLWRIFQHTDELYSTATETPLLIIVKPDGSIERDGSHILERYGLEAYPFTWEKATDAEVAELKKLKLDSLLKCPGYVLDQKKNEFKVSGLLGKRVILIFAKDFSLECKQFLWTLFSQYCRHRDTEYEFELVYISTCGEVSYFDFPWFVHPCDKSIGTKLVLQFFKSFSWPMVGIVAFGQDGHVLAKELIYDFNYEEYEMRPKAFPFIDKDLWLETLNDIRDAYSWGR